MGGAGYVRAAGESCFSSRKNPNNVPSGCGKAANQLGAECKNRGNIINK